MFNGIIYKTGKVRFISKNNKSILIGVHTDLKFKNKDIGSSISCNGVCLTLVKIENKIIFFYLSVETLNRSNFKWLKIGDSINIENSLIFGQKISGHFIQGHVDTTAKIKKINIQGKVWLTRLLISNKKLSKFLVEKASISVNGISLTISKVNKNFFEINIIPHTLKLTNLTNLKINSIVNIELDIFVKYIIKASK